MELQTAGLKLNFVGECAPNDTIISLPVRIYTLLTGAWRQEALNCDATAPPTANANIAGELKEAINNLRASNINFETGRVDYHRLRQDPVFHEYVRATGKLQHFDPGSLKTSAERMAFWINLYNALLIHTVIAYRVMESITEVRGVFDRAAYIVGEQRYSAFDIEQGILRANANHPLVPGARFGKHDPRRAHCLEKLDPRIHFALVCASESCPPINFYEAENLDAQLDLATQHFINSNQVKIDRDHMTVRLSRIFSWYASDFGSAWFGYRNRAALLDYITPYLNDQDDRRFIEANNTRLKVKFLPYNWGLND